MKKMILSLLLVCGIVVPGHTCDEAARHKEESPLRWLAARQSNPGAAQQIERLIAEKQAEKELALIVEQRAAKAAAINTAEAESTRSLFVTLKGFCHAPIPTKSSRLPYELSAITEEEENPAAGTHSVGPQTPKYPLQLDLTPIQGGKQG